MLRLKELALTEPAAITTLRSAVDSSPTESAARVAAAVDLGIALAANGCSYEASAILRPLRTTWKSSDCAPAAREAIETQAWWNKNWKVFVQYKRAGEHDRALHLVGDRIISYWDLPPLLVHLSDIARINSQLDLSTHLLQRVYGLAQRGLPKMNMAPFVYVSQSGLVQNLIESDNPAEALRLHDSIVPNSGNAMAHEMQHAAVLVANDLYAEAMVVIAAMLVTAETQRTGYSKALRKEFVDKSPLIEPLRQRVDWGEMLSDPAGYRRDRRD